MATNSVEDKWYHPVKEAEEKEEDDEEEEEALSLCDLPVTLIDDKDQDKSRKHDPRFNETHEEEEEEQDFDFRSWGGLFSKEPEMCAADEVFFQGQILPLRHSFSSEPGSLTKRSQRDDGNKQFNRCQSRSESMDHGSMSEFRSNSSRSSSLRSQNSSSSTSSTTTTTTPTRVSKPKIRNQFHTIASPKPQLRQSFSGPRQAISFGSQGRKSSAWEFFRLGVVPAPEIGLQDLKVRNSANRNCVSRNSSSSSSNSNSNANITTKSSAKMSNKTHHADEGNHVFKQFVGKGGGLLSGCSCSVDTVAQLDMIKGGGANNNKSANKTESATHAMKEKVVELKKQRHNRQKQVKKVMSRRRTFEWLKELHARNPDEEALLSSSP